MEEGAVKVRLGICEGAPDKKKMKMTQLVVSLLSVADLGI